MAAVSTSTARMTVWGCSWISLIMKCGWPPFWADSTFQSTSRTVFAWIWRVAMSLTHTWPGSRIAY